MRIMTGCATDSAVAGRIAKASRQPVTLKAHILDAANTKKLFGQGRAMAGAAEIIQVARTQGTRIENAEVLEMPRLHCLNVARSRTVTAFAAYAGNHPIKLDGFVADGCSGMAAKALPQVAGPQPNAEGALQECRSGVLMAGCDIQSMDLVVVGDFAFNEESLVFEQEGLPNCSEAVTNSRENRDDNRSLAVRHRIHTAPAFATNLVDKSSSSETEARMQAENFRVLRAPQRFGHQRAPLRGGLGHVTGHARGVAHIVSALRGNGRLPARA